MVKAMGLKLQSRYSSPSMVRHRIQTSLSPRMTANQPFECQPTAANGSEAHQRNVGILRTGRKVSAVARRDCVNQWREASLVQPEHNDPLAGRFTLHVRAGGHSAP